MLIGRNSSYPPRIAAIWGWVDRLELGKYVWRVDSKTEAPELQPDIAIDDMHACELGKGNLIVRNRGHDPAPHASSRPGRPADTPIPAPEVQPAPHGQGQA